jgi:hypothetical protein
MYSQNDLTRLFCYAILSVWNSFSVFVTKLMIMGRTAIVVSVLTFMGGCFMSKLFKVFLAVMFAASVVWADIDWTNANNITITTEAELRELARRTNLGERNGFEGVVFTLANDIDLNGDEDNQWIPIGSYVSPFTGIFDGGGKVVNRIFINNNTICLGLFGHNRGGTIRNLGVSDVNIVGDQFVGGLVGRNSHEGLIENCYVVSGIVSGRIQVGGLTGGDNAIIRNSYAVVNVYGRHQWTGGLVGVLTEGGAGLIENSYARGNVTVTAGSGGGLLAATTVK